MRVDCVIRKLKIWPILPSLNVFTASKGSNFYISFKYKSEQTKPRLLTVVVSLRIYRKCIHRVGGAACW